MRITPLVAAAGIAGSILLVCSTPASAHITIPDPAEQGGFSIVTLSVPNERDDAGTTSIEVKMPESAPLPFVSVQPKPGWTAETTMRTLDGPVEAFGESYDEVVDTVTWSGGKIDKGQFDTFALSVGPLPDDVDELTFPTIQTYDNGEEVSWIQATPASGEEPENPAPVLRLVAGSDGEGSAAPHSDTDSAADPDGETAAGNAGAASSTATGSDGDDDGADPLAIAALVIAVIAVAGAGAALFTARRQAT